MTPNFTAGMLFPDGGAIDLLRGGQLIYRDGEHEQVNEEISIRGASFRPVKLDEDLERVLRIPSHAVTNSSTDELVEQLTIGNMQLGFDAGIALLTAVGTLTTWVPDCLPGGAPVINFWGPPGSEGAVLQVMCAISRRPLHLVDPSAAKLAALAAGLYPTVIVVRPNRQLIANLIRMSVGASVILDASVTTVDCSVVTFTEEPRWGALNIALTPATWGAKRLSGSKADELAEWFQPRLLAYRLSKHAAVTSARCQVEEFAPEMKPLACALGATLQCTPELQAKMFEQLRTFDEQMKIARSTVPAAIVIEALLVVCREGGAKAFISDVTNLCNGILLGRHERETLSAKAVGQIVHKLGLSTKREAAGYVVVLDNANRDRICQFGRAYGTVFGSD